MANLEPFGNINNSFKKYQSTPNAVQYRCASSMWAGHSAKTTYYLPARKNSLFSIKGGQNNCYASDEDQKVFSITNKKLNWALRCLVFWYCYHSISVYQWICGEPQLREMWMLMCDARLDVSSGPSFIHSHSWNHQNVCSRKSITSYSHNKCYCELGIM